MIPNSTCYPHAPLLIISSPGAGCCHFPVLSTSEARWKFCAQRSQTCQLCSLLRLWVQIRSSSHSCTLNLPFCFCRWAPSHTFRLSLIPRKKKATLKPISWAKVSAANTWFQEVNWKDKVWAFKLVLKLHPGAQTSTFSTVLYTLLKPKEDEAPAPFQSLLPQR